MDDHVLGYRSNNENSEGALNDSTTYFFEEEIGDGENLGLITLVEQNFQWNHINTLFFLDEFQKRIKDFRNPSVKKKRFWQEIATIMNTKGYKIDGDILDRKMRNMKATFHKCKDNNRKKRTGRGAIKWEYFERFNEIFVDDKTVNICNITSSDLIIGEKCPTENVHSEMSTSLVSPSHSNYLSNSREKQKGLDRFRKRQIELEELRVEELKKIRLEIAESNRIGREKLELFKKFLAE